MTGTRPGGDAGRSRITHAEAREWLSERMDAPLPPGREATLEAHLAGCRACREVAADYLVIRTELRGLPAALPPRDLTARTLAALDAEAGRVRTPRPAATLRSRSGARSGGVAIGSLLTVALVAVVGILLAGPVVEIPGPRAGATPFAVAPAQLAFVGVQNDVVRLYRSRIDHACPASAPCTALSAQADQVVELPQTVTVGDLALDPMHRRAAITARAADGTTTTYYVLALDAAATVTPTAPAPGSSGSPGSLSTASAGADSSASPGTRSSAGPGSPGAASDSGRVAGLPAASGAARAASPAATAVAASGTDSHAAPHATERTGTRSTATPRPSREPKVTTAPVPTALSTAVSAAPTVSTQLRPVDTAAPVSQAGGTPVPGSTSIQTLPPVPALAILQQVIPTGAAPAWSPDGSTLAFSAMPADGSAGSDIYIWHPGDAQATALTMDHASTFASWAGDRIVGSTFSPSPGDAAALVPESFVIDPYTGARRAIRGQDLWLPCVDPTGHRMVAWSGTLEMAGMVPVPGEGRLVLASWPELDPFGSPVSQATPSVVTVPSAAPASSAGASAAPPAETGASGESAAPIAGTASAGPAASAAVAASSPVTPGMPTPEGVDATPAPGAPRLEEWAVSWAPDGSAFAVWESMAVGSETGTLALHLVDMVTGQLLGGSPLGAPVTAARGFSMGADRLAWTTPPDSQGMRSLRVIVWGTFGSGELRSGLLDQQALVPAF